MATDYPQVSGSGPGPGFRPVVPRAPDGGARSSAPPRRRLLTLAASAAVFIVVAGGLSAALVVFLKSRGTGDVLAKLAPNNTAFYLSVYLDPPAGQKSNFNNLLHRFPDVRDDQQRDKKVNDTIDAALRPSHLSHNDVKAWLGSQLSVIAPDDIVGLAGDAGLGRSTALETGQRSSSGEIPLAVLISSTDDRKAQATMDGFRNGADGRNFTWTDENRDGVPIARGAPRAGGEGGRDGTPLVYAIVNHTAVVSASAGLTHDIIDTAHGKKAALDGVDRFKKAVAALPNDHLALAYVDMQATASQVRGQLGPGSGVGTGTGTGTSTGSPAPRPAGVDALQGLALSLSAQGNGFAVDGTFDFDPAKLTAEQRRLLDTKPAGNGLLSLVPARAYGFLALTGLKQAANSAVKSFGDIDPDIQRGLDQYGVTGPEGILEHLTGDGAVEAEPRAGASTPGGALLLGTNDDAAMTRFLGKVADLAAAGTGSEPVSPSPPQVSPGGAAPPGAPAPL
ncbi:MAG: DUF3352 domain-containing protein, partial [Candidatus Dormibacteria bacterium]